jgi:endonuclease YncB( thermonuclease family)
VAEIIIVRRPHRLGDVALYPQYRTRCSITRHLPCSAAASAHRGRPGRARGRRRYPHRHQSEAYLKQLVEGKRVTVEIYQIDRYKRLLSTVFLDGKDINLAMIEAGLAEVYRGPESGNPYTQQYQAAEEAARSVKKGMWIQGDRYESPRAYRKRVGIS